MRENPPDGLHEVEVHGFVIVLEVDPLPVRVMMVSHSET